MDIVNVREQINSKFSLAQNSFRCVVTASFQLFLFICKRIPGVKSVLSNGIKPLIAGELDIMAYSLLVLCVVVIGAQAGTLVKRQATGTYVTIFNL